MVEMPDGLWLGDFLLRSMKTSLAVLYITDHSIDEMLTKRLFVNGQDNGKHKTSWALLLCR
jgi:hypothetical protein